MGSLVAELAEKLSAATNNLDFDEQTMFLNTSANTVGIGTNAPASKLDVRGTMQVGIDDAGYDVIFYGYAASSNMTWVASADDLILNDSRLYINQDDDENAVLIDSESSSNAAIDITAKYPINATQDISGGYAGWFDRNISEGGSSPLVSMIDDHTSNTQTTLYVRQDGTGDIVNFFDGGTERFTILDGGNVGINQTAPASALHVTGTVQVGVNDTGHDVTFYGATSGAYFGWDESVDTLKLYGGVTLESNVTGEFNLQPNANAVANCTYAFKDDNDTGMIRTAANALALVTAATNRIQIIADGKVGIGTTAPAALLHVQAASGEGIARITAASGENAYLDFYDTTSANCRIGSHASGHLLLMTNGTTERMRINSNGNIGFGTNNAITGTGDMIMVMDSTNCGFHMKNSGNTEVSITTASASYFNGGNVGIGSSSPAYKLDVNLGAGTTAPLSLYSANKYVRIGSLNTSHVHFVGNAQSSAPFHFNGGAEFSGVVTKSSGTFKIRHPLPELNDTHNLFHSFVEAPQADNIYRGQVDLVGGTATVNIDTVAGMTEGTFVLLNREIQCFTSNESGWIPIKGTVSGNIFTITAEDNTCTDTIHWLVIGERQDEHMYDRGDTDEDGKIIIESEITENDAQMRTMPDHSEYDGD